LNKHEKTAIGIIVITKKLLKFLNKANNSVKAGMNGNCHSPTTVWGQIVPHGVAANECDATMYNSSSIVWLQKNYYACLCKWKQNKKRLPHGVETAPSYSKLNLLL
jgi:hypothetical protein